MYNATTTASMESCLKRLELVSSKDHFAAHYACFVGAEADCQSAHGIAWMRGRVLALALWRSTVNEHAVSALADSWRAA